MDKSGNGRRSKRNSVAPLAALACFPLIILGLAFGPSVGAAVLIILGVCGLLALTAVLPLLVSRSASRNPRSWARPRPEPSHSALVTHIFLRLCGRVFLFSAIGCLMLGVGVGLLICAGAALRSDWAVVWDGAVFMLLGVVVSFGVAVTATIVSAPLWLVVALLYADTPKGRASFSTRGRCPHCQYDLTGLASTMCPECGGAFDPRWLPGPHPAS